MSPSSGDSASELHMSGEKVTPQWRADRLAP
jgi:hypothetical protein